MTHSKTRLNTYPTLSLNWNNQWSFVTDNVTLKTRDNISLHIFLVNALDCIYTELVKAYYA